MSRLIDTLSVIAKKAGQIQLKAVGQAHQIEYKGPINIVTEVDRECEAFIVSELEQLFPGDDILAEEGSGKMRDSSRCWIVDPLDGTVNYAHGFPFFCVSIALEEEGELVAGVIYDPNRDEFFAAEKGKGATLDGKEIRVSRAEALREALVATGFAYNVQERGGALESQAGRRPDNLDHFFHFVKRARAVRRPGSAAIDLAWTACGRIDGFWELFLKPWDMAAGVLLIREAGGLVTSFDGSGFTLSGTEILASNGHVHEEMSRVLTNSGDR